MMICMFWKGDSVIRFLVVLVLMSESEGANAFCVIRSDVDVFSNPDAVTCSRVGCRQVRGAYGCRGGNCCMCQCRRNTPNYLIHRKACVPNDEIGDCDFSFPASSEIPVIDFSKAGSVQFKGDPEGCTIGLLVAQWSYRLETPQVIKRQPNNFRVNAGWSNSWTLQWNKGLDAKYFGLILKFDLACPGHSGYTASQCLLVKSKGNYTLSEASPSPSLQVTSDVAVDVHVTGRNVEPTVRTERNETKPGNINNVEPGETAAETEKERKTEEKNSSVVVVSVCLSLVAGIALVCVLVLRRSGSTRSKGRDAGYEEPVDPVTSFAGVKRNSNQSFQNEFYDTDCVLSIDEPTATNKKCRLGPLPPLPGEEGIYEDPMIKRNVGYHGLAQETAESSEQTKDKPEIKEEPPPVYNTLEPPSDNEDGYDDTAERAIEEEPSPVYNTLEPPSDDEDGYDDTAERAIEEEPSPVYNTLEPPSDDEDGYHDTAERAEEEEPPPVYNTLEPPSDDEDGYDDTAEPEIKEELFPVYNTLEPPSGDENGYDDTAEFRCRTL